MKTSIRKRRAILRATDLHIHTIRELEHKLNNAHDSHSQCMDDMDEDSAMAWSDTISAIERVLVVPTVKALAAHTLAQSELDNSLTSDMPKGERRMIIRDLCRAGWFPEEDPSAVCTRKIATIQVDGKRYEVGSYD